MKPKTCKQCGVEFVPQRMGQKVCSGACAQIWIKAEQKRKELQEVRKDIQAKRQKLKTRSDLLKEAQAEFNKWIRLRDANEPCISCGRHHNGQWHAGHYRSVGAAPALRFEPLNVHKQCMPCNTHKSGNIVEYRLNLVKMIGFQWVDWLEKEHEPKHYTREEIIEIKERYQRMARELKREREAA